MKKPVNKNSSRQQKVAILIHEALINILRKGKMLDERLIPTPLTITKILVTSDLKIANCYYLPFNTKLTEEELSTALNNSKFAIRKAVTAEINMKFSPDVRFHYDHSFENVEKVEKLLQKI